MERRVARNLNERYASTDQGALAAFALNIATVVKEIRNAFNQMFGRVIHVDSDYICDGRDWVVVIDADVDVTLPEAYQTSKMLHLINRSGGALTNRIIAATGNTVEGAAAASISAGGVLKLVSDDEDWVRCSN